MSLRFALRKPPVAALKALYRHAWWTKGRRAPDIARMLRHSDLAVCAWEGKALAAFARVSTDYTYRAVIWDVIVHPDHQGRGLGRGVVERVLRHPRLRKVEGFWLYTTDKQPFYRRLGFKPYPRNLMVHKKRAR